MRETDEERQYRGQRAEEFVAEKAAEAGVSRKKFIRLAATSAGAMLLGLKPKAAEACPECMKAKRLAAKVRDTSIAYDQGATAHWSQYANWFTKPVPEAFFINHGHAMEMRWEIMKNRGYLVPNDLFYMQNHFPVPKVDLSTYRLKVYGDACLRPREFTYDEITKMPSVTLTRAMECGENGRVFYAVTYRKQMDGAQWKLGAIGVAQWTGVPLRHILEIVGVDKACKDVMPRGMDGDQIYREKSCRPMPIEKAMADDTLLVWGMNGKTLPPDHGYPIRALVSGWIGPASIKWVNQIEISSKTLISMFNTEYGVYVGPEYPPEPPFPGKVCTWQSVKSAFELPWDGTVPAGAQKLTGRSWSGKSNIRGVDVSLDGGQTWQAARLVGPNEIRAWTCWEVDWNPSPGRYTLIARATDNTGYTQPNVSPYNFHGYNWDGLVRHPITTA